MLLSSEVQAAERCRKRFKRSAPWRVGELISVTRMAWGRSASGRGERAGWLCLATEGSNITDAYSHYQQLVFDTPAPRALPLTMNRPLGSRQ